VEEAAQRLGIGRQLAYDLIRQDEFPVPVLRLGMTSGHDGAPRRIVIPCEPLDALLAGSRVSERSERVECDKDCGEYHLSDSMVP
jgi:hypothetical protein